MKTEDIILIENNAGGEIHLVKDRLFWQAWERSAFLFVHNFKNYKVHHRFVQKVMQDFVWLGFPEKVLGAIVIQLNFVSRKAVSVLTTTAPL